MKARKRVQAKGVWYKKYVIRIQINKVYGNIKYHNHLTGTTAPTVFVAYTRRIILCNTFDYYPVIFLIYALCNKFYTNAAISDELTHHNKGDVFLLIGHMANEGDGIAPVDKPTKSYY